MSALSEAGQEGIHVQLRLLVSDVEQRWDAHGNEVLQLRGRIVDGSKRHPECIVRFGGQRRAELYRWAKPDKHLSVDGSLEVKAWTTPSGKQRVALLIEAQNIFPLSDVEDLSRIGVYAVPGRTGAVVARPAPTSKAERGAQMRRLLDKDDG